MPIQDFSKQMEIFRSLRSMGILMLLEDIYLENKSIQFLLDSFVEMPKQNYFKNIYLLINSNGGNVKLSREIHFSIMQCKSRIIGLVINKAYSAAANILQSCHYRVALEGSSLLFHNSEWNYNIKRNSIYSPEKNVADYLKFCEEIKQWNSFSHEIIFNRIKEKNSSIKLEEVERLYLEDRPMDSAEAIKLGLLDKIISFSDIPIRIILEKIISQPPI